MPKVPSRPQLVSLENWPVEQHGRFQVSGSFPVQYPGDDRPTKLIPFVSEPNTCRQSTVYNVGRSISWEVLFPRDAAKKPIVVADHYDTKQLKLPVPAVLLSMEGPPEVSLTLEYIVERANDRYGYNSYPLVDKIFAIHEESPEEGQKVLYTIMGLFSRFVQGPTFAGSDFRVSFGQPDNTPYQNPLIITVLTTSGFLASHRLLHGVLGVLRSSIEFLERGYTFEDLLPSWSFEAVHTALDNNQVKTLRRMFLEVIESMVLFRGGAGNCPFSSYHKHILEFVAIRSLGVSTFLMNAARAKVALAEWTPGHDRMPGPYRNGENLRVKYNIMPYWTNTDLGFRGWWETGGIKCFRGGLQSEFAQFCAERQIVLPIPAGRNR